VKKLFLFLFICISNSLLAQNDERLPVAFLKYFNQEKFLHLNNQILIDFENELFICNEFVDKSKLQSISKLEVKLKLTKLSISEFSFKLDISSKYSGTFEVIKEEDGYYFFIKDCVKVQY
jgi:hypothetical protein